MPSPLEGEISLDISLNFCWPFLQGPAAGHWAGQLLLAFEKHCLIFY